MAEPEAETREPEHQGDAPAGEHADAGKDGKKPPAKGAKKPDRAKAIIVISSVAAVFIGFLSLKGKGSATTTASTAGGSIGAYTPSGDVTGTGSDSSALQGLQTMLDNQAQMLASQTSALAGLTSAGTTAAPVSTTPAALSTQNFGAPVVTGNIHQDTDISQSSYIAQLYAAYKKKPTQASQQAYIGAVNQFDAAKKAGTVNTATLQH